ncbi:MAG: hypothetical protein H0U74_00525 [Bradymonadaceae bacterium]|nr:hypothetical protein [Lujinxingiaceae bacterium]
MNTRIPNLLTFAIALALSVGTVQATSIAEADARPGSTLGQSRTSGKRVHKMQAKKEEDDDKKKNVRPNTTNAPSGQQSATQSSSAPVQQAQPQAQPQARPQGNATATGRTRPTNATTQPAPTRSTSRQPQPQGNARTTGRVRPTQQPTTRTTRTTRTQRSTVHTRHSSTTHHHHHHYDDDHSSSHVATRAQPARSTIDGYLTLGLGLGGFAAGQITDLALPGAHFNLGLGGKGKLWGAELGFNGGGYTFDTANGGTDLSIMGVSVDVKLQPSLWIFEPYILAGLGGYLFQDGIMQESALGGALRLGLGADLRFGDIAVSARYLFSSYAFGNDSLYPSLAAQTESLGVNLTFYF